MGEGDQLKGRHVRRCWRHPSQALLPRYSTGQAQRPADNPLSIPRIGRQRTRAALLLAPRGLSLPSRSPRSRPNSHPQAAAHHDDHGSQREPMAHSFCQTTLQHRCVKYFQRVCTKDKHRLCFVVFMGRFFQPGTPLTPNSPLLLAEGFQ